MPEAIGLIGVGNMGTPIAHRLIEAGYRLVVHDVNEAAVSPLVALGARSVDRARAVGEEADVVFVCLPTPQIVEELVSGPDGLVAARMARTVIDLSTTGSQTAARIGKVLADAGKVFVDSPVSGGIRGARMGTLAVMVSGPAATFEQVKPILSVIGKVFYVGSKPGAAQTMKLVNNLLSGAALAISSEALVWGVKAGLDPRIMLDVINAGSGRNSATQDKFPRSVLPRTFDFGFTNRLMYKDIDLCVRETAALGLDLATTQAVHQLWAKTLADMGPEMDFTTIVKVIERAAGVEVREHQPDPIPAK